MPPYLGDTGSFPDVITAMDNWVAQPNTILLPFGAQLQKCAGMSADYIVGLDNRFALEMITTDDVLLETDKLIDSQLDVITVSIRAAFRVMLSEAVHVLSL